MGPSWYWMPDIFDNLFADFNLKTQDFYKLIQLDPGFKIIFDSTELSIPSNFEKVCSLFEKHEKGGSKKLKKFIKDAEYKYNIGMNFVYKSPGLSIMELLSKEIILNITNFELLTSYRKHISTNILATHIKDVFRISVLL